MHFEPQPIYLYESTGNAAFSLTESHRRCSSLRSEKRPTVAIKHVNQTPNTEATNPKNITSPSPLGISMSKINDTLKISKTSIKSEKTIAPSFAIELS